MFKRGVMLVSPRAGQESTKSKLTDKQLEYIWCRDRLEKMSPEMSDKDHRALNEANVFLIF